MMTKHTYMDLICDIARREPNDPIVPFLIEATAMVWHTPIEYVSQDVRIERRKCSVVKEYEANMRREQALGAPRTYARWQAAMKIVNDTTTD